MIRVWMYEVNGDGVTRPLTITRDEDDNPDAVAEVLHERLGTRVIPITSTLVPEFPTVVFKGRLDTLRRPPVPGRDFDPDGSMCQDDYEYWTGTGQYARHPGDE
jgi:hypothetical protein